MTKLKLHSGHLGRHLSDSSAGLADGPRERTSVACARAAGAITASHILETDPPEVSYSLIIPNPRRGWIEKKSDLRPIA
jgi:hypothetical protein